MHSFLITDVGSTTTKAILIENQGDEYRLISRAEAPTTVEAPYEDVTIGVANAIEKLGATIDRDLSGASGLVADCVKYYSSSSAGGGLQVLVIGLYSKVTGASAKRAALGAGAILLDVISSDDERPVYERIDAVRTARPDMILLTGGIDGGSTDFALEFADIINSSNPKPRFGEGVKLPVIYAGNKDAAPLVSDTLAQNCDLHIVDNIRPTLDSENLAPARNQIHELFLSHVMQQAPGYHRLSDKVAAPIMPTPKAVGQIMTTLAEREELNILGMDIGGATTDIFSVLLGEFYRTVSANMGMSYSIGNVMESTGVENIKRWLPFEIDDQELKNTIATKMLFPTTLPSTVKELMIEQAVAREALRVSIEHHKQLITTLPKTQTALKKMFSSQNQNIAAMSDVKTKLDMQHIGLIIGSGGVLSHAPRRQQAALMLADACEPVGITELAVDSIFMMPHLGVLSQHYPDIALDVLVKDCFIPLGTLVSGRGEAAEGEEAVRISGVIAGERVSHSVKVGEMSFYDLGISEEAQLQFSPSRGVDIGKGPGKSIKASVSGGRAGLIIDMRLDPYKTDANRFDNLKKWMTESGAFTAAEIDRVRGEK